MAGFEPDAFVSLGLSRDGGILFGELDVIFYNTVVMVCLHSRIVFMIVEH